MNLEDEENEQQFKMQDMQATLSYLQSLDVDESVLQQLQQLSHEELQEIIQRPDILRVLIQNHLERENMEEADDNQAQSDFGDQM